MVEANKMIKWYNEGKEAYKRLYLYQNPYPVSSDEWAAWCAGWQDAMHDNLELYKEA